MQQPQRTRPKAISLPRNPINSSNDFSFEKAEKPPNPPTKSQPTKQGPIFGVYIGSAGTILTRRSYQKQKPGLNRSVIHDRSGWLYENSTSEVKQNIPEHNKKEVIPPENPFRPPTSHFSVGTRSAITTAVGRSRAGTLNRQNKLNNTVDYMYCRIKGDGLDTSLAGDPKGKGGIKGRQSIEDQFLVYVSKDETKGMTGSQKAFYSFRELSNQVKKGQQQSMLKNIATGGNTKELEKISTEDQSKMVKKCLAFNKKQEKSFISESEHEREQLVASITKMQGEEYRKRQRMPPVKVFPSLSRNQSLLDDHDRDMSPTSPGIGLDVILQDSRLEDLVTSEAIEPELELHYEVYWHDSMKERFQWQPDAKEGHSLTKMGNKLVLYGGISAIAEEDVAIYDIETHSWSKPPISGDIPLKRRHGHSACVYGNTLVVFGGQNNFNGAINLRECLNDVRLFSLSKNEWKYKTCDGQAINGRRNHGAAIYNNNMYVYGGVNIEGKCQSDVWSLNLGNFTWTKLIVSNDKENGVGFHSVLAGFNLDLQRKSTEFPTVLDDPQEIFYCFGGRDNKGAALNVFKILKLSPKKYYWKYPKIQGLPPAPRYAHSMIAHRESNVLIIYGGKTDKIENPDIVIPFRDICVLDLKLMTWISVSNLGFVPEGLKYNHAAAMVGTEMIIFGGVGSKEYSKDGLVFLETDHLKVKRLNAIYNSKEKSPRKLKKDRYNRKDINVTIRNINSSLNNKLSRLHLSGEGRCVTPENSSMRRTQVSFLPVPRSEHEVSEYEALKAKAVVKKSLN